MKTLRISLGLALLQVPACKTTEHSQVKSPFIKPSALIGTAYNAYNQEFTGLKCLDASALTADDYEMIPIEALETSIQASPSEEALQPIFGRFQKSFYTPATGFRLAKPYESLQRLLEGEADAVKLASVVGKGGVFRFKASSLGKLRWTAEAQLLVDALKQSLDSTRAQQRDAFTQACGTGFLSGTGFTLAMVASLRWIFGNAAEKQIHAPSLMARSLDDLTSPAQPSVTARLRYEMVLKESPEFNMRRLAAISSRDCLPHQFDPCLAALRDFTKLAIPRFQKYVQKNAGDLDLILPLAYLDQPEVSRYAALEPELEGLLKEPSRQEQDDWQRARDRFARLYIETLKLLQRAEWFQAERSAVPPRIKDMLHDVSVQAAPCYQPLLDLYLCHQEADRLQAGLGALSQELRAGLFEAQALGAPLKK